MVAYLPTIKRTSKSSLRRRVTVIAGARAREICELQAKSAEDAVKRAARDYGIDPRRQKRLAAYRVTP